MKLFETKVANDKVSLKGDIKDAKLVLSQEVDLIPLIAPVLQKVKDLIPGHFDDALIDDAVAKVAAMTSSEQAQIAQA